MGNIWTLHMEEGKGKLRIRNGMISDIPITFNAQFEYINHCSHKRGMFFIFPFLIHVAHFVDTSHRANHGMHTTNHATSARSQADDFVFNLPIECKVYWKAANWTRKRAHHATWCAVGWSVIQLSHTISIGDIDVVIEHRTYRPTANSHLILYVNS